MLLPVVDHSGSELGLADQPEDVVLALSPGLRGKEDSLDGRDLAGVQRARVAVLLVVVVLLGGRSVAACDLDPGGGQLVVGLLVLRVGVVFFGTGFCSGSREYGRVGRVVAKP